MAIINIKENDESAEFEVRVIPRASGSEIVGEHNGALKVKVASPPVEGAANEELIRILSRELGVAKVDIKIVSGQTSRTKRIRVPGCTVAKIKAILRLKS